MTRAQFILLYLALTGAIATGLAIFSSASTIISLTRTATMAFLMEPAVSFLEGVEVSRVKSIFVIYFLLGIVFYLAVAWLSPQWTHMWTSLATDLPRYTGKMISLIKDGQVYLEARMICRPRPGIWRKAWLPTPWYRLRNQRYALAA